MEKVRGILAVGIVVLGSLVAWGAGAARDQKVAGDRKAADDSSRITPAERFVREALAAELSGDNARRDALLAQALQADPNCRAARWQAGYVNLDGKWLTPEEAARKFAADRDLTEYRHRRDQAVNAGLFSRGEDFKAAVDGDRSVQTSRNGALAADTVAANAQLARWCRTKRLADEERAHWTQVLMEEPNNGEAESRLGMRWYMGGLYTFEQIGAMKEQRALEAKQLAQWKPTVSGWRKSLDNGSDSERVQAAEEMKKVTDPAIIAGLEWAGSTDSAKPPASRDAASPFQREAVALLGHLPMQRATYSLTQHAVLARQSEVRTLAAFELKKRPLHDFVPVLLAGLANPIEFEYAMSFDPTTGLMSYQAATSQEERDKINEVDYSKSEGGLLPTFVGNTTLQSGKAWIDVAQVRPDLLRSRLALRSAHGVAILPGAKTTTQFELESDSATIFPGPRNLSDVPGAGKLARQSQQFAASVDDRNERIELTDRRINYVLERVSGRSSSAVNDNSDESDAIPDSAVAKPASSMANYWWNWWADYNETYSPPKQVFVTAYSHNSYSSRDMYSVVNTPNDGMSQVYNSATRQLIARLCSCFAAKTPVITIAGPVAIEKLQIGDRVLAQDADSGELAYKPVLGTTIRPPVEMVAVTTTSGTIRATRGHPFWIVGKGWRMAKELEVGNRVQCLNGTATVTAIASQPAAPAYNLIVADFGTYFVGDGRILVHDTAPRLPTRALLPGYVLETR